MMETAATIEAVLGEHADRCVQAQQREPEDRPSRRLLSGWTPAEGGPAQDTAGDVVFSPPILRRTTRERPKWEISD